MKCLILIPALCASVALRAQTINEYRWWLNDDIAAVTMASIAPAMDATLSTTLGLPSLNEDFSTITVQFKDSNGEWSVPHTVLFVKGTGMVNGYEYWIDDAIASSTSGTIGPNTVADLIADLPTNTTPGDHVFTIRFSSANGTWSVPLSSAFSFTVGVEELPGLSDLLVFPNPATDQLGLRLNSDGSRTLRLDVLDLSGQQVLALDQWAVQGSGWRNWDISGLADGTYLLWITDEQGSWATRFVKQ